jgi:hypothetical protein
VHVGAALVADEEALEAVQPGEGALDDPAVTPQTGAVLGLPARDHRLDASLAEQPAVLVVVVAAVGDHAVRSMARPANKAAHRGHCIEERDQLGDVVAVRAGEREREREPLLVNEEMVLGAGTPIDRARARRGAPFFACTWLESTIARAHSISPAARRRASKSECSRSHTAARCHSSRRRQHVTPRAEAELGG